MNRLIIGAPFGHYYRGERITRTIGTYTLNRRAGLLKRCWRVFSTVRYERRTQSWVNKLGLPNPGIATAPPANGKILSIYGEGSEWSSLVLAAQHLEPEAVEFNLGCPNATLPQVADVTPAIRLALRQGLNVIVKLPPLRWMELARPCYAAGARCFHCCNTILTPGGGMSGKPLKQYSLWAIEELRKEWGDGVVINGGGGVTTLQDVKDYVNGGADRVVVGSMLMLPWNAWKLYDFRVWLDARFAATDVVAN